MDSLLASHWSLPIANSQSSPKVFRRRSWQASGDEPSSRVLPNISLHATNESFPALESLSCLSGFDASKFSTDIFGNSEATSGAYESMARKLPNHMSVLDVNESSGLDLLQMGQGLFGFATGSGEAPYTSGDVFDQGLLQQQHMIVKSPNVSLMEHDKRYLTSNLRDTLCFDQSSSSALDATMGDTLLTFSASSYQRFPGENTTTVNPELLESSHGSSVLNISSSPESVLDSHNYLYESTQKKTDPFVFQCSRNKWPNNSGIKDFTGNPGPGELGAFGLSHPAVRNENKEGCLVNGPSWPSSSSGQYIKMDPVVSPPGDVDSRRFFPQMNLGIPCSNNSHKRLHTETQDGETAPPASAKRSSSWASSLTSTGSKFQDAINTGSNSKCHAKNPVGPALNTNLKPRARQGTANDPQSIAARHRRERISERLKVLQDLVPNGSKVDLVTMLEKATSYVKFLQLQVKVLTTDDYWPSNEKGAAPCTALPNFEDMEGALKELVAQVENATNSKGNTHLGGSESSQVLKSSLGSSDHDEADSPGSSTNSI